VEVVKGTLSASVVVLPHHSSEKARKSQVCLDTEPVQDEEAYPQHNICQPIEYDIGLPFPSFFGCLRHSR
jgi:hypothetical protein